MSNRGKSGKIAKENYLTAIIHTTTPQVVTGNNFLKYRNIPDVPHKIASFASFAKKFPGADYINFYYQHNRSFKERLYLE